MARLYLAAEIVAIEEHSVFRVLSLTQSKVEPIHLKYRYRQAVSLLADHTILVATQRTHEDEYLQIKILDNLVCRRMIKFGEIIRL